MGQAKRRGTFEERKAQAIYKAKPWYAKVYDKFVKPQLSKLKREK